MTTVGTLKTQILRGPLQDASQTNYSDNELWDYFNKAISFLSKELARLGFNIGLEEETLTYTAGTYYMALPSGFLRMAVNDEGFERVYNQTDNHHLMYMAEEAEIDSWADESASDDGTPSKFYFRGNYLYIHPRPDVSTTVKFLCFKKQTITNDDSTIPWNGLFDELIEQFVVNACRWRSQMVGFRQMDQFDYQMLRNEVYGILAGRGYFKMKPPSGAGWTTIRRVKHYTNPTHY